MKQERKLNKILFFRLAIIGAMLLFVAAFWCVFNWGRRPIFIQDSMATFKHSHDGRGLGFTFGYGSVKGRARARILGWGYGWGLDEDQIKEQFLWFSWTTPDGRVHFDLSSDIKLTGQDISTLTVGEWENQVLQVYVPFHFIRIKTPGYWINYCTTKEVKPDGVTTRLEYECEKEEILEAPLTMLKEQIPSISEMKVVEYLFFR